MLYISREKTTNRLFYILSVKLTLPIWQTKGLYTISTTDKYDSQNLQRTSVLHRDVQERKHGLASIRRSWRIVQEQVSRRSNERARVSQDSQSC